MIFLLEPKESFSVNTNYRVFYDKPSTSSTNDDDLLCATVSVRGVIQNIHGQVLIVQRSSDHNWELPGGRLGQGEPPR